MGVCVCIHARTLVCVCVCVCLIEVKCVWQENILLSKFIISGNVVNVNSSSSDDCGCTHAHTHTHLTITDLLLHVSAHMQAHTHTHTNHNLVCRLSTVTKIRSVFNLVQNPFQEAQLTTHSDSRLLSCEYHVGNTCFYCSLKIWFVCVCFGAQSVQLV